MNIVAGIECVEFGKFWKQYWDIVAVIECGKLDLQEVRNSQATFLVFSCPVSRGKGVLVGQGGRLKYPITQIAKFYGSSDDL